MTHCKIRVGAMVGQDFTYRTWPISPGLPDTVFDVEHHGSGRACCRAANFGGNPYGNGAVYVDVKDLVSVEEEASAMKTEAIEKCIDSCLSILVALDRMAGRDAEANTKEGVVVEARAELDALLAEIERLKEREATGEGDGTQYFTAQEVITLFERIIHQQPLTNVNVIDAGAATVAIRDAIAHLGYWPARNGG